MAFDPGQDLLAGQQFANTLAAQQRKADAYAVMSNAFGKGVAGDPQGMLQAQQYQQNEQINPLQVQAAQRQNVAQQTLVNNNGPLAGDPNAVATQDAIEQQQRLAQFRALKMLGSSVNAQTGAVDPATFDNIVGPNAQTLGLDPAHIAPLRAALTAPGGAQHLDTIEQALIGPTHVTGAPIVMQGPGGQSMLANRDQYGNLIITSLGAGVVPVQQQRANQGQARIPIAQENATAHMLSARSGAANKPFGPGDTGTPQPQNGGGATSPTAYIDSLPAKGRQMAIGQAQQVLGSKLNLSNANAIADSMAKQITPYTTGAGVAMNLLPGTVAKDLERNAETLRAQAAQAVLSGMKGQSGQTGLGRVLQSEYKNFTAMYGNLAQDQSTKQYAFHLSLLQQSLNHMQQLQDSAYTSMWKATPEDVLHTTTPNVGAPQTAPAPTMNPALQQALDKYK